MTIANSVFTRLPVRTLLSSVALAATLAAVGVQAQTAAPAQPAASAQATPKFERGNRADPAARQQRMAERHTQRMADLKAKLGIRADQESAWNTWSASMKPPTWSGQRLNREQWKNLSTPERLDRMLAMQQERTTQMRAHADATKTFYNALNAEQKKVFDEQSLRMGPRDGHRGGKGGPGPR